MNPTTQIKEYVADFSVDTIHTKKTIYAYSTSDAKTLIRKMFVNCKIEFNAVKEIKNKE